MIYFQNQLKVCAVCSPYTGAEYPYTGAEYEREST